MHKPQTVLGFDFGTKYIGVAVGSTMTQHAQPLKTLITTDANPPWSDIKKLIAQWQAQALIVGMPTQIDGSEQWITKAAQQFYQQLADRFGLPVHTVDERLSTVEARQRLFDLGGYKKLRTAEIDSFAATIILEQWLSNE